MWFSFDVVSFFLQSCPPTTMTLLMASSEAERQSHMTTDGEDGNYITEVAGVTSLGNIRGLYI